MKKIEPKYKDFTFADELLDQIVIHRLTVMAVFCIKHNTDSDVLKACLSLLDWMGKPNAED